MIWRLLNKLLGWEYILGECGYSSDMKVVRVHKLGNKFFYRCKNQYIMIAKQRFHNSDKMIPLSMSQEQFDQMIKINEERLR